MEITAVNTETLLLLLLSLIKISPDSHGSKSLLFLLSAQNLKALCLGLQWLSSRFSRTPPDELHYDITPYCPLPLSVSSVWHSCWPLSLRESAFSRLHLLLFPLSPASSWFSLILRSLKYIFKCLPTLWCSDFFLSTPIPKFPQPVTMSPQIYFSNQKFSPEFHIRTTHSTFSLNSLSFLPN